MAARFSFSSRSLPLAGCARYGAIRRQAGGASRFSPAVEILGNVLARTEVHLVGSLALKSRVRESSVVFPDVEVDEASEGARGVEFIQVKPLVLVSSTPSPCANRDRVLQLLDRAPSCTLRAVE